MSEINSSNIIKEKMKKRKIQNPDLIKQISVKL